MEHARALLCLRDLALGLLACMPLPPLTIAAADLARGGRNTPSPQNFTDCSYACSYYASRSHALAAQAFGRDTLYALILADSGTEAKDCAWAKHRERLR
eukprot:292504-Pleurochrysis_carterae.AAC.1